MNPKQLHLSKGGQNESKPFFLSNLHNLHNSIMDMTKITKEVILMNQDSIVGLSCFKDNTFDFCFTLGIIPISLKANIPMSADNKARIIPIMKIT